MDAAITLSDRFPRTGSPRWLVATLAFALLAMWLSLVAVNAEFSPVVWATPVAAALIAAGALLDAPLPTGLGAVLLAVALGVSTFRFGPVPAILYYPFVGLLMAAVWVAVRDRVPARGAG